MSVNYIAELPYPILDTLIKTPRVVPMEAIRWNKPNPPNSFRRYLLFTATVTDSILNEKFNTTQYSYHPQKPSIAGAEYDQR